MMIFTTTGDNQIKIKMEIWEFSHPWNFNLALIIKGKEYVFGTWEKINKKTNIMHVWLQLCKEAFIGNDIIIDKF